jgi:F-type H+-transporting ATPase subunit c
MRLAHALVATTALLLLSASPVFAQTSTPEQQEALAKVANPGRGIGAGIGMGLAVVGIGIGLGIIGYAALSGIARQPEQAGAIQGAMFILAGLVEGAGIIALVLCLLLVIL